MRNLIVLFLLVTFTPALAEEGKTEAVAAAKAWLGLVDQGDYAQAWEEAAPFLQGAVTQKAFADQLKGVRGPLGAVTSRRLAGATYQTSLPGAPDGKYWVLQFETGFANKTSAVETITPMLSEGAWKVSGYYIK